MFERESILHKLLEHKGAIITVFITLACLAMVVLLAVRFAGKDDAVPDNPDAQAVQDEQDTAGGTDSGPSGKSGSISSGKAGSNPVLDSGDEAVIVPDVGSDDTLPDSAEGAVVWENGLIVTDDGATNGREPNDNPTDEFGYQASMPYDKLSPSGQRRYGGDQVREYDNSTIKSGEATSGDTSTDAEPTTPTVDVEYAKAIISEVGGSIDTATYSFSTGLGVAAYKESVVAALTRAESFADAELKVKINAVLADLSVCGTSTEILNVLSGVSARALFGEGTANENSGD